ncbi:hypothetical protein PoB_003996000 [Plakobranchus ocellatus]|uniref:Uncharacterized protein n=1 Tax=Plakobranchus ocellatus TaxID=259542 RepID=A0AAV4B310_9GAST|nr:hypothetical protein PoB_003996000 [Plakobranchus ocellatus]
MSSSDDMSHNKNFLLAGVSASPQKVYIRLSGPPSGQDASGGTRTRDRRIPEDIRADSLASSSSSNNNKDKEKKLGVSSAPNVNQQTPQGASSFIYRRITARKRLETSNIIFRYNR